MELTGHVVVGFDGSDESERAVDWAAAEARRRGAPLTVLYAEDSSGFVGGPAGGVVLSAELSDMGRQIAEQGAVRAGKTADPASVHAVASLGVAAWVLIDASERAALVVVGNRGRGPVGGTLLGSVAFAVTAHSRCPVVVVRGEGSSLPDIHLPVAVGVDDSAGAAAAVAFAAGAAAAVGAALRVVCVWPPSTADNWAGAYWSAVRPGQDPGVVAREAAERVARDAVAEAVALHPGLRVESVVVPGPVAPMLAVEARGARLLVVGRRGRGGFPGLRLGSAVPAVIHDAGVPVAVVPAPESADG